MTRDGQQALRRCRSHSPSEHQPEHAHLFPDGRRPIVSSSGARPLHRRGRARAGAARSRCRGAAALLSEAKHRPRPRIQCLPTFARMTGSNRRAHASPPAGGAWEQQSEGLPRRADAISKAGVRRPDTGRVVRHEPSSCGWLLLALDAAVRDRARGLDAQAKRPREADDRSARRRQRPAAGPGVAERSRATWTCPVVTDAIAGREGGRKEQLCRIPACGRRLHGH
jgi:hypothetical protein